MQREYSDDMVGLGLRKQTLLLAMGRFVEAGGLGWGKVFSFIVPTSQNEISLGAG